MLSNVWATRLCDAIVNAGGRLVDNARIPAAIVAAAFEAAQTASISPVNAIQLAVDPHSWYHLLSLLPSLAHPSQQRHLPACANGHHSSILFRRNNL
jgi:hypothetical protein